ncbi:hypothetical protein [Streptomyces aureocirculatus]|uniref:hypothetical protein n=1 Tax=Streptomyces aureocirculatus TaxID=67275 RepID=UPI00068B5A7A|nr:hypothetical protein [Streptomyces aureocirculatus]
MWWVKARRAQTLLPAALACLTALVLLVQDTASQFPSLRTGDDNPVMLMLLVPLPLCAALLASLESRLPAAEDAPARRVRLRDAGLTLAAVTAATVIGVGVGPLLDSDAGPALGRNTAFFVGLMLCTRAVAGQPAVMTPVLWFAAVVFFGSDRTGHPAPWTVLPHTAGNRAAALTALLTLTAGLIVQMSTRPRATT